MTTLFVARSAKFSQWASDVGLSKRVFKVGCTDGPPESVVAQGWGGENDWSIVKKQPVDDLDEAELIARLQRKEKMIDPIFYPRLRGAMGIFKVAQEHVEGHILVAATLAGGELPKVLKLKPEDFAEYLIHNALGARSSPDD
jgi:hypothetical protein